MEDISAAGDIAPATADRAAARGVPQARPDVRRSLQLILAAAWILDAALQAQPFMFSKMFGNMTLAGAAAGNPSWVAHSITWAAAIVTRQHLLANAAFAAIQLLLGLGIAWRPTIRPALAASVGWAVSVWWFGEGLGGVLTNEASPVSGAPGAALLYALLALAVWPTDRRPGELFVAARLFGARTARLVWLLLWGGLAYFAVLPANRAPQRLHDLIGGLAAGEPRWLSAILNLAATAVAHRGLEASVALAVLLSFVAAGVYLPPRIARASLALAMLLAATIWVAGQALGGIFTGSGTDPNSAPLLALLAVAYWPALASGSSSAEVGDSGRGGLYRIARESVKLGHPRLARGQDLVISTKCSGKSRGRRSG